MFGEEQGYGRLVYLESVDEKEIIYQTDLGDIPHEKIINYNNTTNNSGLLVHQGRKFLIVSAHSSSLGDSINPNWRIHVLLDTEIAYDSVVELQNYFLFAGTTVLLIALGMGYFISRSVVRPVNDLVSAAKRISAGDYNSELPNKLDKSEIGVLTNSFDMMRIAVRDKEEELVTKNKALEQASRLKGEFVANMSHELRTPINGVLGTTELLLNTELKERQARYAKTILRSGNALLSVINDILEFSKIEAGKVELSLASFDLRKLAEDVTELVAEAG